MALNKNTKRTIIILSSLAAVIIIGIATGVITFDPVTKSKSNTYGKSEQCFAKLKKKLSNGQSKRYSPRVPLTNALHLSSIRAAMT